MRVAVLLNILCCLKVRFSILFPVLLIFRRLLQNAVIVRGMQLDRTNYSSVAYDLLNEMKAIGTTLHQEFADYNTMHRLYTRRVKKQVIFHLLHLPITAPTPFRAILHHSTQLNSTQQRTTDAGVLHL